MLYISDTIKLNEGILGVTDTEDGVTEYISLDDIQNSGLDVKGFEKNDIFTAYPYSKDTVIYLGDRVAPPITPIVGRYYRVLGRSPVGNDHNIALHMYNLLYLVDGVPTVSICKLHEDDNRTNYRVVRTLIDFDTPVVEVTLDVFTNSDKLCKVLNVPVSNTVTVVALNTGVATLLDKKGANVTNSINAGDNFEVSTQGIEIVCNDVYTDIMSPSYYKITKDDNAYKDLFYFCESAYSHIIKGNVPEIFKDYWITFLDVLKSNYGRGITFTLNNRYGYGFFNGKVDVSLAHRDIFGINSGNYNINRFGGGDDFTVSGKKPISEFGQDYADNIVNNIKLLKSKGKRVLHINLYGAYLIREDVLEKIKVGESTHLNTLKTKLKLISNVTITKITNRILYLNIPCDTNTNQVQVDLESLLSVNNLGNIDRLNLTFSGKTDKPIYLTIPKGINHIDYTTDYSAHSLDLSNITLILKTTLKGEVKNLLKTSFVQDCGHRIYADELKLYVFTALLFHINIRKKQTLAQHLFDLLPCTSSITATEKTKILQKLEQETNYIIDSQGEISHFTNCPKLFVISEDVRANMVKLNIISNGINIYSNGSYHTTCTSQHCVYNKAEVFISVLSEYMKQVGEPNQFLIDIAKLYMRALYIFSTCIAIDKVMYKVMPEYGIKVKYHRDSNSFYYCRYENFYNYKNDIHSDWIKVTSKIAPFLVGRGFNV